MKRGSIACPVYEFLVGVPHREVLNNFYTGRLRPEVQLFSLFLYTPFMYPFRIPSVEKWYPFHIPCLEICNPFNCCKCTVI